MNAKTAAGSAPVRAEGSVGAEEAGAVRVLGAECEIAGLDAAGSLDHLGLGGGGVRLSSSRAFVL